MQLPLVVFSPVRWTNVSRRPQHFLTRLGRTRRIYYIEEPRPSSDRSQLNYLEVGSNVCVVRPDTICHEVGFTMAQMLEIAELLPDMFDRFDIRQCDIWCNTPLVAPLFDCFSPNLVLYDVNYSDRACNASHLWNAAESAVLRRANLVTTATQQIFHRISNQRPDAVVIESGVDVGHFFCGVVEQTAPGLIDPSRKRLGLAGVLDSRVDFKLIDYVASAHPEWEVILLGPSSPAIPINLPRRANIKHIGPVTYRSLPGYLKNWDLALMPYRSDCHQERNDAAKIREYFAAGLPVVATDSHLVPCLDRTFGVSQSPGEFVSLCEKALSLDSKRLEPVIQRGYDAIPDMSWDRIAYRIEVMIEIATKVNYASVHSRRADWAHQTYASM